MNHLRFFICLLLITISPFIVAQTNYYVNTTSDRSDANLSDGVCADVFGFCTLRAAMEQANANDGNTTIRFAINTPATISPANELPTLKYSNIIIDASAHATGSITIDGNNNVNNGFIIDANNCGIGGLYIKNFVENGIVITKSGTNAFIQYNAINNNGQGVYAQGSFLYLDGNYIGMHPTTGDAEGNERYGIEIFGSNINVAVGIEGGNIIGSNGGSGLYIHGRVNADIYYNYFGTRENRDLYRPNGTSSGIGCGAWLDVHQDSEVVVEGNVFYYNEPHGLRTGSTVNNTLIRSNEFQFNAAYGIWMEGAPLGSINHTKHITQNSFYCNNKGGIRKTENANENVAAPKILAISNFLLQGTAAPNAQIEVYLDQINCNNCEGRNFFTSTNADAQGNWLVTINGSIGDIITATATVNGSTSEFSRCKPLLVDNDEPCINDITALTLTPSFVPCSGQVVCASTYNATDSSPQVGNALTECKDNPTLFTGADIWFTSTIPNTGNLMIRQHSDTEIDVMMEVYVGDCFNSMKRIDCANFYYGGKYYVYEEAVHGYPEGDQLFFRVYDTKADGNVDAGNVVLSAHILPTDEKDWIFCDENNNAYDPHEFILHFSADVPQDTITDWVNFLTGENANLVRQCKCAPRGMFLFGNDNFLEIETVIQRASGRARADTVQVNRNFFGEDLPILNQTTSDFPPQSYEQGYNGSGDQAVRIGIVDSGVHRDHPLIQQGIWNNPNPNSSCAEADDSYGYDFTATTLPDPIDQHVHGTAVNGAILSGLGTYNDVRTELINAKFHSENEGDLFAAVCGTYYLVEQQVEIINMSFGMQSDSIPRTLQDVLDHTLQKDILVITSAGNDNTDNDREAKWPANYDLPNIISVAAFEDFGSDYGFAHYSNFGHESVDLVAAGHRLLPDLEDGLSPFTGTSIAAPAVTQTAAIIRARYPELSAQQVRDCILSTTHFDNKFMDRVSTDGRLDQDAAIACAEITTPLSVAELMLTARRITAHSVHLTWSTNITDHSATYALYRSFDGKNWHSLVPQLASDINDYQDDNVPIQEVWYQLKVATPDGISITQTKHVKEQSIQQTKVFPNPLQNRTLQVELPTVWWNKTINAILYDMHGRKLWQVQPTAAQHLEWDLSALPDGIYWLELEQERQRERHKIVLLK